MFHQLACSRLITLFYFLNILLLSLSLLGLVFFVLWALPWRLCLGDTALALPWRLCLGDTAWALPWRLCLSDTAWALAWRLCLGDIYMDSFKKTDAFCNSFRKATVQTIPYMSIQIVTDLH